MTQLYYLNKNDHHQQRYLMGGLSIGALCGLALERDLQRTMLNVVPWAIHLALMLSLVIHSIWHGRKKVEVNDETCLAWGLNDQKMDGRDMMVEKAAA